MRGKLAVLIASLSCLVLQLSPMPLPFVPTFVIFINYFAI